MSEQPPAAADPIGLVTEALIDANDQLLAMYDLAELTSRSLDETMAVGEILGRARRVVQTDEMFFVVDGIVVTGTGANDSPANGGPANNGPTKSERSRSESESRFDVSNAAGHNGTLVAERASADFGTAEIKLLSAIANLCLGASHAARMHAQGVTDAVMQRDHDTASTIAVTALPRWRPSIDGASCFARSDPARSAGGDLFAFGVEGQRISFVFGDVAGKGLPAAMMMTTVISAATAAFQLYGADGPTAVIRSIDEWVFDHLSGSSLFVTLVAGEIDMDRRQFRLVNAGHSPMYMVSDNTATSIEADTPPIGVFRVDEIAPNLECQVFDAGPGDRLVISSDGFNEQCDEAGEMFGDPALEAIISTPASVADLGVNLFNAIEEFALGAEQSDDRTLFILGVNDDVDEVLS